MINLTSIVVLSGIFSHIFIHHNEGKGAKIMISYEPLWETMRRVDITTYALINKYGVPSSTVHGLKHNKNINMYTLERLCNILNCTPDQVVKFEKE